VFSYGFSGVGVGMPDSTKTLENDDIFTRNSNNRPPPKFSRIRFF
jgi:hypothetical protein